MKNRKVLFGYVCVGLLIWASVPAVSLSCSLDETACNSLQESTEMRAYITQTSRIFSVFAKNTDISTQDIHDLLDGFTILEEGLTKDIEFLDRSEQNSSNECSFLLLLSRARLLAALNSTRLGVKNASELYCEVFGCDDGLESFDETSGSNDRPVLQTLNYIKYASKLLKATVNGSVAIANAMNIRYQYNNCNRNLEALSK